MLCPQQTTAHRRGLTEIAGLDNDERMWAIDCNQLKITIERFYQLTGMYDSFESMSYVLRHTMRYDTRCYFNVRSKADTSRAETTTKNCKTEKLKKEKQPNRKSLGNHIVSMSRYMKFTLISKNYEHAMIITWRVVY